VKTDRKRKVLDNIDRACRGLSKAKLMDIPLETADRRFLDLLQGDLDEHIAMQPAAIAYFGYLLRCAKRDLQAHQRRHDRWRRQKYLEAKDAEKESGSKKPTIQEIEARVEADNKEEVEEWDAQLWALQEQFDTLECYFDGWRQKGFSIQEHVKVRNEEYMTKSSYETEDGSTTRQEPQMRGASESRKKKSQTGDRMRNMKALKSKIKSNDRLLEYRKRVSGGSDE